ncbi:MAG TPA: hypothetical protein VG433_09420 [Pirellulales bacterium]|nr:hypothetical protein [Pirellulales bacterium]
MTNTRLEHTRLQHGLLIGCLTLSLASSTRVVLPAPTEPMSCLVQRSGNLPPACKPSEAPATFIYTMGKRTSVSRLRKSLPPSDMAQATLADQLCVAHWRCARPAAMRSARTGISSIQTLEHLHVLLQV